MNTRHNAARVLTFADLGIAVASPTNGNKSWYTLQQKLMFCHFLRHTHYQDVAQSPCSGCWNCRLHYIRMFHSSLFVSSPQISIYKPGICCTCLANFNSYHWLPDYDTSLNSLLRVPHGTTKIVVWVWIPQVTSETTAYTMGYCTGRWQYRHDSKFPLETFRDHENKIQVLKCKFRLLEGSIR